MEKTIISLTNEEAICGGNKSVREVLDFLESGALYRNFKDVVMKVFPDENVARILSVKFSEITGKDIDSVSRNVRNWLSGRNLPQREQLFQICFALSLNDVSANVLISFASDTGIHYRNPVELIYAYCLKFGLPWNKACELTEKLLSSFGEYQSAKAPNREIKKYTRFLKSEFDTTVKTEEDLERFIIENRDDFGSMHMTAYADFIKMITYLQDPDKDYDDSYYDYIKKHTAEFDEAAQKAFKRHEDGLASKSVADVVDEFLRMHVPENKGRGSKAKSEKRNYTYLQEVIKKNWPSESIISKMKNRDTDVSRKVMILLHLLTEEFESGVPASASEEEQNFWLLDTLEEESENAEEIMEMRLMQLNLFLDNYGMNRIDPGNPFDCLILYALKASYSDECDEYMSERLETLLGLIFEYKETS